MKRPVLFLSAILLSMFVLAQPKADSTYSQWRYSADSLTNTIDTNKIFTTNLFTGNLMWGDFRANCYYKVGTYTIPKMEIFFVDSAAGKKVLYFDKDNGLIKIINKGLTYYYTGSALIDSNGKPVKPYIANDIIFFSQEVNKLLLNLLE